jgi:hypothetical protein
MGREGRGCCSATKARMGGVDRRRFVTPSAPLLRASVPSPGGRKPIRATCSGPLDLRAQAELPSALRPTHRRCCGLREQVRSRCASGWRPSTAAGRAGASVRAPPGTPPPRPTPSDGPAPWLAAAAVRGPADPAGDVRARCQRDVRGRVRPRRADRAGRLRSQPGRAAKRRRGRLGRAPLAPARRDDPGPVTRPATAPGDFVEDRHGLRARRPMPAGVLLSPRLGAVRCGAPARRSRRGGETSAGEQAALSTRAAGYSHADLVPRLTPGL